MKDSVRQQQSKSRSSDVYKTESGFQINLGLLPAGRLSEELKVTNVKRFWNTLDTSAKQVAGITMRCFWKLKKTERDELREIVCDHYNVQYTRPISKRWVYIMTHPSFPGSCKVGITNNVRTRLFQYQVGCPIRAYRLEYARQYQDVDEAVETVYQRLDDKRLKGEWFEVPANEVIEILTELSEGYD